MNKYLSEDELNDLIKKVKSGDNIAWEAICKNFDRYVHERAWKKLRKLNMDDAYLKDIEQDLHQAGWGGFISAIRNFNPERGKLLTYATSYIDSEISKELNFFLNPLGLTKIPKLKGEDGESDQISKISFEDCSNITSTISNYHPMYDIEAAPVKEKYNAERRALQILELLKLLTDEEHTISKEELGKMLISYRRAKYNNGIPLESPNTLTCTLESILQELAPMEYSDENDHKYRIKYEGYKDNRLKKKLDKEKGKKAKDITGFSYVHIFRNEELNKLIQLISFSDILSLDEKNVLIKKLVETASVYYKSPFWDGEKIRFNPKAIHGRLSSQENEARDRLSENLKIIQIAINNMGQIRFKFNRYTAEHTMIPKTEFNHTLSPYRLVVYHDNYYCIGLKNDDKRVWHYRVNLMSEVELLREKDGKIISIEVSSFEGLPISNTSWNPEKYMSEHLNMAYDKPQDIRIKIRNNDYNIICDWFGDYYEKTDESCEEGYDIVRVRTSPSMIVHWAMQYGEAVEIMDEEIRESIKKEIERMYKIYG